jgi:DNA-binding NarL/FixJ family response regulator
MKIRLVIVEDSEPVRDRIKALVSTAEEIEVVGEAGDIDEAIDLIQRTRPDAVTLDLHLPGGNGLQVLQAIRDRLDSPKVIIVTNYPYLKRKSMEAGADHFVDKSKEIENLLQLLLKVSPSHD